MEKCRKCKKQIPEGARFCPHCGTKQEVTQRTKNRGNGTGSVYKLANGTWIAVRVLGYQVDAKGAYHKRTVSKSGFATKKEALAHLPKLGPESRVEAAQKVSLREVYDRWEPTWNKSKSTMDGYRAAIKKFAPVWNIPISQITVDDLQECIDEIPGHRTQQNARTIINLLYKYAIPRHMAALNMGQYLRVGGEKGPGKEGLPMDALAKIMAKVGKVPYADFVAAQCYLGFRPSELLDLEVTAYDRKERTLTGGAKTEAGKNRVVPINPKIQFIIDGLTQDRIGGYIFGEADGSRMAIEDYRSRFYQVLEACGIDNPVTQVNGVSRRTYTPHSCRHTFATLMKNVPGADKDKLRLIGHTSMEMTRHYQDTHLPELRAIVEAM